MKFTKAEKKQLLIFVIITYGVTCVMGLIMGFGYTAGKDVSIFPSAQMLYPAAGVILAYLITRKTDSGIPRKFFVSYLIAVLLMILCAVCSVTGIGSNWAFISQLILMGGSIVCGILLLADKKERRSLYGLRGKNAKLPYTSVRLKLAD